MSSSPSTPIPPVASVSVATCSAGVTSLELARAVRAIGAVAREAGLSVPAFRSPPAAADVDRSIRRGASGGTVISVRLTGRPFVAVEADIIDGLLLANGLSGAEAARCRRALWIALAADAKPLDQAA